MARGSAAFNRSCSRLPRALQTPASRAITALAPPTARLVRRWEGDPAGPSPPAPTRLHLVGDGARKWRPPLRLGFEVGRERRRIQGLGIDRLARETRLQIGSLQDLHHFGIEAID